MPDSTIAELEQMLTDSKSVRRRVEPQMMLNLAYHQGKQWMAYDGTSLYEPALEDWRATPVDNRIRATNRTEIARLTKTRPVWVGRPEDTTDDEIAAARLREQVFEHYWRELELTRKLRGALMWSRVCGAAFLKWHWDKSCGAQQNVLVGPDKKVIRDENGAPLGHEMYDTLAQHLGEDATQRISKQRVGMGDVRAGMRSPFHIYPDDLATDEGLEESAQWLIEESVHRPKDVAAMYGEEVQPDAAASFGAAESRMPGLGISMEEGRKTGVKLREFWAIPCSAYPKGKWCVWAGEKLLQEAANPYPWLPYTMISGSPVPGRFWPDAPTTDLISPNTSLNKRKAQIEENAERIGNPPLMRSSANEEVTWLGLPGEDLVFQDTGTPGSVPQFLQVPELPMYVREDVDRHVETIRELSGHYEISSGGVPAGVTAAAAINLLTEQNDQLLGPDAEDMESALTGGGRRILWMLWKFASNERLVQIAGEDEAWNVVAFKGSDLRDGGRDGIAVGSAIPQSKAAKQAALQEVLNMFAQAGVPMNERDLRRVMQQYEVGGLENFFASIGKDERQVNRENQRLANGEELPINSYDDDEFHIAAHQDFQKSSQFDRLDPPVKQLFEAHVGEHLTRYEASKPIMPQPDDPNAAEVQPASVSQPADGVGPSGGVPSGS